MRQLGQLASEELCSRFYFIALSQGIDIHYDREESGPLSLWVVDEDQLGRAKELFAHFCLNPEDPSFQMLCNDGQSKFLAKERQQKLQAQESLAASQRAQPSFIWTGSMLMLCIFMYFFATPELIRLFLFSNFYMGNGWFDFYEIQAGQVWRLFTPIFLHGSLLHLGFNMLWFLQLGREIEGKLGGKKFLFLVLLFSIPAHIVSFWVSGPHFVGMSGVIYGMVTFIWAIERYEKPSRLQSDPQVVATFLVWYIICLVMTLLRIMPIANTIHAVGALMGYLAGFIASGRVKYLRSLLVWHRERAMNALGFLALLVAAMIVDYLQRS